MELCVNSLSSRYAKKDVIHGIGFSLMQGEVLAVLGANGSGKTTLFKALMRFLPVTHGSVVYDGTNMRDMPLQKFAGIMSYIPQTHTPTFSYTVAEMAMMGRARHIPSFGTPGKRDDAAVDATLRKLNIMHLKDKYYTEISGGERRLALIARALCQQAGVIVMDEPSADLDYANQRVVMETIRSLKQDGYSIILSTHAPEYPFGVADKALLLKDGGMVAYGTPDTVLQPQSLQTAFGVEMEVVEVTDSKGNIRKLCLPI